MSLVKNLARIGLHQMGGLRPILWRSRKSFRILTYHRFSPAIYPDSQVSLAKQCAFLKERFHLVSLSEIGQSLQTGRPLPDSALAVTIDDGYRDILMDAFSIFQKFEIPVTVFLITDFIDRKLWPWWNQVEYAVRHAGVSSVHFSLPGSLPATYSLLAAQEKEHACTAICAQVKGVPNNTRVAFIRKLPELFQVDLPAVAPPEYAALHWDEIRTLAKAGMEFGAHTVTHPILPNVEDPESVYSEIADSKKRIEQELGRNVPHFCYPNGDFNDTVLQAVERCGFQTAVTTRSGLNTLSEPRYLLKRLSAEPGIAQDYFCEELAGLHS